MDKSTKSLFDAYKKDKHFKEASDYFLSGQAQKNALNSIIEEENRLRKKCAWLKFYISKEGKKKSLIKALVKTKLRRLRFAEMRRQTIASLFNRQKSIKNGKMHPFSKYVITQNANFEKRLKQFCEGAVKLAKDLVSLDYDLVLRASKKDECAIKRIREKLDRGVTPLIKKNYQVFTEGEVYSVILEACKKISENKRFRAMEWIIGLLRRKAHSLRNAFERKPSESDCYEIVNNERGKIQQKNRRAIAPMPISHFPDENQEILVKQMAAYVHCSPQTLRNLDINGIYKSEWELKGRRYCRIYRPCDYAPLLELVRQRVRREPPKNFVSREKLAEKLKVSERTLIRHSHKGNIPKPELVNSKCVYSAKQALTCVNFFKKK
ncbi:MAG: hypothetical protein ABH891_07100 [Candidatus Omnitrophota bacterium]